MIFNLYYISCKYVKPMNCMVLGNKQYNTIMNGFKTQIIQILGNALFKTTCYTTVYLSISECIKEPDFFRQTTYEHVYMPTHVDICKGKLTFDMEYMYMYS